MPMYKLILSTFLQILKAGIEILYLKLIMLLLSSIVHPQSLQLQQIYKHVQLQKMSIPPFFPHLWCCFKFFWFYRTPHPSPFLGNSNPCCAGSMDIFWIMVTELSIFCPCFLATRGFYHSLSILLSQPWAKVCLILLQNLNSLAVTFVDHLVKQFINIYCRRPCEFFVHREFSCAKP